MTASFTLSLDVQAPASPTLSINSGATGTGEQPVWVTMGTADYEGGADDVSQMKIWGDVDSGADLTIQPTEGASSWIMYADLTPVLLSAGTGRKTLYARLRDDVGNTTVPFSDFIDLDASIPVIDITTAIDRSRISKVSPYSTASFTWTPSMDVVAYEVRVVPSHGSPHQTGVALGTAHGSIHVSGAAVDAAEQVVTTISGADLEAASPGSNAKVLKVFVRTADGIWST